MNPLSKYTSIRLNRTASPKARQNRFRVEYAATLLTTAEAWEQEGRADGAEREIIGAADETFFDQMMLVFLDLKTGYLLREEVAEDRTYPTWKALVEERLK